MRLAVFSHLGLFLAAVAHAQPVITLETASDRRFYRRDSENKISIEARVIVSPAAHAAPAAIRNVALVLDGSGSMAGERIQALRGAVASALNSLAATDIVSVLLFGSEVETLIEAQRRDQIRDLDARIAGMQPAGGAALYDALNQAAALLRRHAATATVNHLILITDGPPTKGPRTFDDFVRLAGVFATEGLTLSTIGLGDEFEEDTLAAVARVGNGRFRYVVQSAGLAEALQAELTPSAVPAGVDAELTIRFQRSARQVESLSWKPAIVEGPTVTYRFPRLFAGQTFSALSSAEIDAFGARNDSPEFVTIRLRWKDPAGGEARELSRVIPLHLISDSVAIRESRDAAVSRTIVNLVVREALQEAIEDIDKGDFRRALRDVRNARNEARDVNFELDDAPINETIRRLDTWLASLPAAGLTKRDRKTLRSGLFNQFEPPFAAEEPKN